MKIETVAVGLVSLVVSILVIVTVAVPVVEDSQNGSTYSGENSGYDQRYSVYESAEAMTIQRSGAMTYNIGGNTVELSSGTVLASDKLSILETSSQVRVYDYGNSRLSVTAVSDITAFSVSITATGYSWTLNGTTTTGSQAIGWMAIADNGGSWGRFNGSFNASMGTEIIMPHIQAGGNGPGYIAKVKDGTVNGFVVAMYGASGSTIIESAYIENHDFNIGFTESGTLQTVGSYTGGYTLTYGDNTTTLNGFIAPLAWESANENENSTGKVLLGIIPILLILVCVMMAVRMIAMRE